MLAAADVGAALGLQVLRLPDRAREDLALLPVLIAVDSDVATAALVDTRCPLTFL
jgi:hypothetical protein